MDTGVLKARLFNARQRDCADLVKGDTRKGSLEHSDRNPQPDHISNSTSESMECGFYARVRHLSASGGSSSQF